MENKYDNLTSAASVLRHEMTKFGRHTGPEKFHIEILWMSAIFQMVVDSKDRKAMPLRINKEGK